MSPQAAISAEAAPASERVNRLCIDTIRTLTLDAVEQAGSGHPGGSSEDPLSQGRDLPAVAASLSAG